MDPKPPGHARAPDGEPSQTPRPDPSAFPRVDAPLVRPETGEELFHGRLVIAAPAHLPHARRQAKTASVAEFSTAADYQTATELLTCTGADTKFATDVCILRKGIDPTTGARYLEELVFEVVAEQSLPDITERTRELSHRGVRRIIAIFAKTDEVREWSPKLDDWITLDPDGMLEDHTLATPIPVRALLESAVANRAVVRALRVKQDPAILEVEAAGLEQGLEQGRAQMARRAIAALCEVLDIPFDTERQALLQTLDATRLEALHDAIRTERRWP